MRVALLAILLGMTNSMKLSLDSIPACNSIECKTESAADDSGKPPKHPKDYFVPNFGMDRDISGGFEDLTVAEKLVGHRWTSMGTDFNKEKFKNRAKDVDYNFAPKLDDDMIDSQNNLKASEIARDHVYTPF